MVHGPRLREQVIAASDRQLQRPRLWRGAIEADQTANAAGRSRGDVEAFILVDQRRERIGQLFRLVQQIGAVPQRGQMSVCVDDPAPTGSKTDGFERGPTAFDHLAE